MVLKKLGLGGKDESSDDTNALEVDDSESGMSGFDESGSDSDGENLSTADADEADEDAKSEAAEEEVDEEDELVKAIKAAKEVIRDHPPDIIVDDGIVDICFHPVDDLIAVGTMSGDVLIYKYTNDGNELVATHEIHSSACRDIEFSEDGNVLYSVSKDKSIMMTDMATGKLKGFFDNAHEEPIYCLSVVSENIITTGDDDGVVRMWDVRQKSTNSIFSLKLSEDYISDMITNAGNKYLVCSSGDGSLSTINMNARKIFVQSEEYESELTCLGLFRNETKILVGTSKGKMYLYNWGEFGLHSDEYSGPKQYINCMVPITENIVVMAGEEGVLRATHLFPHKHLGVVGQHKLAVDCLDICNTGDYIASCSNDNDIKFWNISYFNDMDVNTSYKKQNRRKDLKNNLPSSKFRNVSDFFSAMS